MIYIYTVVFIILT